MGLVHGSGPGSAIKAILCVTVDGIGTVAIAHEISECTVITARCLDPCVVDVVWHLCPSRAIRAVVISMGSRCKQHRNSRKSCGSRFVHSGVLMEEPRFRIACGNHDCSKIACSLQASFFHKISRSDEIVSVCFRHVGFSICWRRGDCEDGFEPAVRSIVQANIPAVKVAKLPCDRET